MGAEPTLLPPSIEERRPAQSPERDCSTLSNYTAFQLQAHTALTMRLDFDRRRIRGTVVHQLKYANRDAAHQGAAEDIHLDTSYLDILAVKVDGTPVKQFTVEPRSGPLGSRLVVTPASAPSVTGFSLEIDFETTEQCTALQWLDKEQAGGGHPYVFTQLEAIHARSLFPCFDTPSVKSTFEAEITSPLPVVFSGTSKNGAETRPGVYTFEQKVPIPAYLIGIASGDLSRARIGPRSHVYATPEMLRDAQWEFEGDVEQFITAGEAIVGQRYGWGTYDILVNVASYPYGGMESPNMTFATPTLIAHDKSNIDVIAHELAHSWSGNLVTNCSWNHFWLNEGWTVYLERRILARLQGEPARHFSALIGWSDLENSIAAMRDPTRFSTLVQRLDSETDPDDAFSTVPYEKGFNLLFHLEQLLGGPSEFDPFIKHYFGLFAHRSLDTFQFLDTLFSFYRNRSVDQWRLLQGGVDWATWLFAPGLPPKPEFDTSLATQVYALADRWIAYAKRADGATVGEFRPDDVSQFNANQVVLFLETLSSSRQTEWSSAQPQRAAQTLLEMYAAKTTQSQNAEVIAKKFKFACTARLAGYDSALADWLGTVGRMKFVRPGYRLLQAVNEPLALQTFQKYAGTYHPICRSLVAQDLGVGN